MSDGDVNELIARVKGQSTLRDLCATIADEHEYSLDSLTVLSAQNDPYRIGEESRADAEWFTEYLHQLVPGDQRVHLRGFHYRLVATTAIVKPNGELYRNDEANWLWLLMRASKAARWLGYVPFDRIRDARNDEPIFRLPQQPPDPPRIQVLSALRDLPEFEEMLPDIDELLPNFDEWLADPRIPELYVSPFERRQPYRIVLWGEKSSLDDVLGPLADHYDAELFLTTGEATDTLIYEMAQRAAQDDRPTVILYFSDFDPSGWQMPISVSRKLQAFRDLCFADLNVQVHRVALTMQQVKEFDLPASPLKESDLRAGHWQDRWGHEQTEIDALAVLRPDILTKIARDSILQFHDVSLSARLQKAQQDWKVQAQARVRAHPKYAALKQAIEDAHRNTANVLTDIHTTVTNALSAALEEVAPDISQRYKVAESAYEQLEEKQEDAKAEFSKLEPPGIVIPEPDIDEFAHDASLLFDSNDDWLHATQKLINVKDLRGVEGTRPRRARL